MIYRTAGPGKSNNPSAAKRKSAMVDKAGIGISFD